MTLIILLGQTCSGKSQMAVDLAKKLGYSWIVNCDSRQVYQYLNIGTAKVDGTWQEFYNFGKVFIYQDIPHFLIDFVNPIKKYSLHKFLQDWCNLFQRYQNYLPEFVILTGGTGLFAKGISHQYQLGDIDSQFKDIFENQKYILNQQNLQQLQKQIEEIDGIEYFNQSDFFNRRRLINRILQYYSQKFGWFKQNHLDYPQFEKTFEFAITIEQELLKERIKFRLNERIQNGLLLEVSNLQIDEDRLWELGLEYRISSLYLKGWLSHNEWKSKLFQENCKYAKRQLTWLKKQSLIWIDGLESLYTFLKLETKN